MKLYKVINIDTGKESNPISIIKAKELKTYLERKNWLDEFRIIDAFPYWK